jgi:hypothetical protein
MSDIPRTHDQHGRPHSPPLAAPFLEFDLKRRSNSFQREPEWLSSQNAKTFVKYDNLRVDLTALRARGAVAPDRGTDLNPDYCR